METNSMAARCSVHCGFCGACTAAWENDDLQEDIDVSNNTRLLDFTSFPLSDLPSTESDYLLVAARALGHETRISISIALDDATNKALCNSADSVGMAVDEYTARWIAYAYNEAKTAFHFAALYLDSLLIAALPVNPTQEDSTDEPGF